MPMHRVKLVDGARDKAHDVNVSFLESEERHDARVDDDGYVLVDGREFRRLRAAGLVEDAELEERSQGRNAEDEDDPNTRERSQRTRDHDGETTALHPGGVGHQPDDAYSNAQVQREIQRDEERGAARRRDQGLPPVGDTVPDEVKRSDHALPEQQKEQRRLEQERDKAQEQDRKERQQTRRERRQERAKEQAQTDQSEGHDQAKDSSKVEPPSQTEKGQPKDQSRSQRNDKVKDALKADDRNDDKPKGGK